MIRYLSNIARGSATALCTVAGVAALALLPTAVASATTPAPTFSAKLVSFHANDESGADWLGSDEVYAGFLDRSEGTLQYAWTSTHNSVDSGDTKTIASGERCVTRNDLTYDANGDGDRQPREGDVSLCFGSRIPTFEIALYDKETSWKYWLFNPNCICTRLHEDDELLFHGSYQYSAPTLMSLMPKAGDKKILTLRSQARTNADYTVTVEFLRQS
jgi:hypothetical protein